MSNSAGACRLLCPPTSELDSIGRGGMGGEGHACRVSQVLAAFGSELGGGGRAGEGVLIFCLPIVI